MGKELSLEQKEKALKEILPESIDFEGNFELPQFSRSDLGRGMLNHERFGLVESLLIDNQEEPVTNRVIESHVLPSSIDNVILSFSLKAFLLSKEREHNGDLAVLVPPFSYAFPLFFSYHLILQHLGENLSHMVGARFDQSKGILVVTDNIEMLSHIWRTSIGSVHLRDFIDTYTIEAGKFKEFSFEKNRRRKKTINDGSLPWIALYRAVRHSLPEELDKKPEIIILDLLPYRHRNRAKELIDWAKRNAKHVIVTGPIYDDEVNNSLSEKIDNILAIDHFNFKRLYNTFGVDHEKESFDPVTACWNLHASLPFIANPTGTFYINKIIGNTSVDKLFSDGYMLIANSKTKNGNKPKAILRLSSLLLKLSSLPIPLEWYERSRRSDEKPTLRELIHRASKIPPESYEEKIIIDNLMPQIIHCLDELYSILKQQNGSAKSEALTKLIHSFSRTEKENILIIVDDYTISLEMKIWLKFIGVSREHLNNLKVITQEEWAKNHLKEIYLDKNQIPKKVIFTNPLRPKYHSSFFFSKETNVYFTALPNELSIIKKQIAKVCYENQIYKTKMSEILYKFFKITKLENDEIKYSNIEIFESKVSPSMTKNIGHNEVSDKVKIDSLFDENLLLDMMSYHESDQVDDESESFKEEDLLRSVEQPENCRKAIKIIIGNMHNSEQNKCIFSPVEQDCSLKIKKVGEEEVADVHPLEIHQGDIWVKLRKNERKELFFKRSCSN